jgi:PPOX class probable F420-dependent enzyme
MDPATMQKRLAAAHVARLATVRPDGAPHVVPCCFTIAGEIAYSAVDDAKPKTTAALARLANIRAHSRASLLVDHYEDNWSQLWWVRVDGSARVLDGGAERERALDLLVAKYAQYRAARPPGAVVAIDIDSWRAWP